MGNWDLADEAAMAARYQLYVDATSNVGDIFTTGILQQTDFRPSYEKWGSLFSWARRLIKKTIEYSEDIYNPSQSV